MKKDFSRNVEHCQRTNTELCSNESYSVPSKKFILNNEFNFPLYSSQAFRQHVTSDKIEQSVQKDEQKCSLLNLDRELSNLKIKNESDYFICKKNQNKIELMPKLDTNAKLKKMFSFDYVKKLNQNKDKDFEFYSKCNYVMLYYLCPLPKHLIMGE